MRRVLLASMVVPALVITAACSSATGGHGTTGPSVAPAPSTTSTAPSTSPSTSSSPSSSPSSTSSSTSTSSLACTPGAVTATGGPFCYPLPAGFTDFSTRTDYGSGWTYRTLIGVGGSDLIEVLGSLGTQDFDRLSATQLRAYFDRAGLIEKGKLGFTYAGPVVTTTMGGARAFQQQGTYSNGVSATLVRAFSGHTIVFVSCQSLTQNARVALACGQVISRVQIART